MEACCDGTAGIRAALLCDRDDVPGLGAGPIRTDAGRVAERGHSLVVTLWGAVAFSAPFLNGDRMVFTSAPHSGWAGTAQIATEAQRMIRGHRGPVLS